MKKGLSFTIMVVGASGLGKSTFVNTLCEKGVLERGESCSPEKTGVEKTLSINPVIVDMEEDGVKLQLTVIDTPGFGDNINNQANFDTIMNFVEAQYDEILAEETRIKRNPKFQDNRIHALLYFISPSGHALRELDIEFMRRLGTRVNVIPVIAKSDSLSPNEVQGFKQRVMQDIKYYRIPIYDFPDDEEEDDEDILAENSALRSLLPFTVVGADTEITVNGRQVRCRNYPWGIVEVDNSRHCDFSKLRYLLLSSHMQDLKEITHDFLYENYRTEKLSKAGSVNPDQMDQVQVMIVPSGMKTEGSTVDFSSRYQ